MTPPAAPRRRRVSLGGVALALVLAGGAAAPALGLTVKERLDACSRATTAAVVAWTQGVTPEGGPGGLTREQILEAGQRCTTAAAAGLGRPSDVLPAFPGFDPAAFDPPGAAPLTVPDDPDDRGLTTFDAVVTHRIIVRMERAHVRPVRRTYVAAVRAVARGRAAVARRAVARHRARILAARRAARGLPRGSAAERRVRAAYLAYTGLALRQVALMRAADRELRAGNRRRALVLARRADALKRRGEALLARRTLAIDLEGWGSTNVELTRASNADFDALRNHFGPVLGPPQCDGARFLYAVADTYGYTPADRMTVTWYQNGRPYARSREAVRRRDRERNTVYVFRIPRRPIPNGVYRLVLDPDRGVTKRWTVRFTCGS